MNAPLEPSLCRTCQGSGRKCACETCEGNGWVDDPSDGGTMTCPECNGEAGEPCVSCEGSGEGDV